jgi:hypothetical protein
MCLGFKKLIESPIFEVGMLSVTVTLSQNQAEKLLSIIEECERCLVEARSILSMNASTKLAQASTQQKTPSIDGIKWRVKGGGSAGPSDDFAFDFVSDRDGRVSKEKAPIIDYVMQKGSFQVDRYEITLSKDGKFLQRIRVLAS